MSKKLWPFEVTKTLRQNCPKVSVTEFKHAKRGLSAPFHQKVKTRKLSGMMFSTETQVHESRKPIMNDIFFNFLIALLKYSNDYEMVMVMYNQEV